jgi:predicted glycosyltransferase
VLFFAKIIHELKNDHRIIITCRPLSNTIELLELEQLDFTIIGKHYGVNRVKKIIGLFRRIFLLFKYIRKFDIDISVSHSSFYLQIVSGLLKINSLYINDNEHAPWNKIGIFFAKKAMFPEPLIEIAKTKNWHKYGSIEFYEGIKEGVYLWDYERTERIPDDKPTIYIRTEPWNADYYKGKLNFIDDLILELVESYSVFIIPRGEGHKVYYSSERFSKVNVLEKSISQYDIFDSCDLFIGAGGTMTRECAAVGIPTISIYQGELLMVDKYLIEKKAMIHCLDVTKVLVDEIIMTVKPRVLNKSIIELGYKSHNKIKNEILSLLS